MTNISRGKMTTTTTHRKFIKSASMKSIIGEEGYIYHADYKDGTPCITLFCRLSGM